MLTIQIHDQAVQSALAALAQRVRDPTPLLEELGEDLVARTMARFDSGSGPDGQRWREKKVKDGRPTLAGRTGLLRQQIVSSAVGSTMTVKATMEYSASHQFGGTIQRKAGTVTVRHRTNAKGELLRSAIMGGRGLVFAKASHKRALERSFDHGAYAIHIPARPYLPVRADGSLYADELRHVLAAVNAWLANAGQ
jgi:phage gpG-like protein